MSDIAHLEARFQRFISSLPEWLPDGVQNVDLAFLHRLQLLSAEEESQDIMTSLTRHFHVVEAPDKITLFNEQFVAWILPQVIEQTPMTFTLIALQSEEGPIPETAFVTIGVYNTSRYVLRILERLLEEIHENEVAIRQIKEEMPDHQ